MTDVEPELLPFLVNAGLSQYAEALSNEGWESVQFLRKCAQGHVQGTNLQYILAQAPINMKPGHIHKLLAALTGPGNDGSLSGGQLALMPPSALRIPRPLVLMGGEDDESVEDGEKEDEEENSVVVFWSEGYKYKVPLDYSTVGELLEDVRVQAKKDGCKHAPKARPPNLVEWAKLVLPSDTGAVEHQTILTCSDALTEESEPYRKLSTVSKGRSVAVLLEARELRRHSVHLPSTPHFRMKGDAKVALCDPERPNKQYDRPDDSRAREMLSDAVELRFYLSSRSTTTASHLHVSVAFASDPDCWHRVSPHQLTHCPGELHRIIVSGLSPSTEYRFRVRMVGDDGAEGQWAYSLTNAKTGGVQRNIPDSPRTASAKASGKRPVSPQTAQREQQPRQRMAHSSGAGSSTDHTGVRPAPAAPATAAPAPAAAAGQVIVYPDGVPPGCIMRKSPSSNGKDIRQYRPGSNGKPPRPWVTSRLEVWRIYWADKGIPPPTAAPQEPAGTSGAPLSTAGATLAALLPPPPRPPPIAPNVQSENEANLHKLKDLYENKLISKEVYEAKQNEILKKMGL